MTRNIRRWLRFRLERWIQRGVVGQLLFMAALIVLISIVGGVVAHFATDKFPQLWPAIWWAFLRLTDPGYLGDDEGAVLRVVSTVITVLGYVVFMGSLIAILTQWLSRTIRTLEGGLTPISMANHVVILGWTNRTPEIVVRLLTAKGRLTRFLSQIDASKLRVVILAEEVTAELRLELREYLGQHWRDNQVYLRSGSSLQSEHLKRLDLSRASIVLIPGSDFAAGGADLADTKVVKTLLSLKMIFSEVASHPHVVAEIFDPDRVPIARTTMKEDLEVVAGDHFLGRLISQSVRHRGLSQLFLQFLSHRSGDSLYIRSFPPLAGAACQDLHPLFPRAVVVGLIRRVETGLRAYLNPSRSLTLEADDRVVLLAHDYESCDPSSLDLPTAHDHAKEAAPPVDEPPPIHCILIFGWSHKIVALVAELYECPTERFELTIVSTLPVEEREQALRRVRIEEGEDHVTVTQVEADYALLPELEKLDLHAYQHILFLGRGRTGTAEEADARTILAYVLVRSLLSDGGAQPEIFVELLDPENARLFAGTDETLLVSPRVLSHILAHVALRPELNSVYEALFRSGGTEVELRPARAYRFEGKTVGFGEIQAAAAAQDQIAIGVSYASEPGVRVNPDRSEQFALGREDCIAVLAGHDEH